MFTLHKRYKGVFVLCEFSQDPGRIPDAWLAFRYPDRVFCGNLGIDVIREWSFCVSFPRTPKGSRVRGGSSGILTVCFVGIWLLAYKRVFDLCEFSQDPERLPCARFELWSPDRVFCGSFVTCVIRECSFSVSFPRTPKGSRVHGWR